MAFINSPAYEVVEEFGKVVLETGTALIMPDLNYQYGYVRELKETLQQFSDTKQYSNIKFPCVWLEEPFDIICGESPTYFGRIPLLRIVILEETDINYKAQERREKNFRPVIYPIYYELLRQLDLSMAFQTDTSMRIPHKTQDRYYWGEDQQMIIDDVVDCKIIELTNLRVNNKNNCITP